MDRRGHLTANAALIAGLVTLGLVVALTLRPGPTGNDGAASVDSLQADIAALRVDIERLRQKVEESPAGGADLSAVEARLDGLDSKLTTISSTLDGMDATARAICQLVVDSPFVPDGNC